MIDEKSKEAVQALAKHRNFRAAADAIGTSPASFSRYINQAETYAGHPLFERSRKGACPTPTGEAFLRLLDTLHNATSQFESGVEKLRSSGSEILNIGCGPLTTRTVIAPLLADLLNELPDLRVNAQVRANKEPLEALRMGTLDVAVCDLTHTPDLSDLDIQVLRKERVSFWARPQHPIHQVTPVGIADIFRRPFITAHLHRHWQNSLARILGGDEEAWRIVGRLPQISTDDFALMTDLSCRVDLICGGMREDFAQHMELGLLQEVPTHEALNWNICAARRKGISFPALDLFWTRLRDQFVAE